MICENCGRSLEGAKAVISAKEDRVQVFCINCASLFGTCAMCANTQCGFANDPDPMPQFKLIARKFQQGGATFIQRMEVPNSERIKKFCIEGNCPCLMEDEESSFCGRASDIGICSNYKEKNYD